MADETPQFIPPPPPPERPLRARPNPLDPPPPAPAPPPAPPKRTLFEWLGVRAARRPEPRLGISLAAAGAAMAVVGSLAIGGDQLVTTRGGGGSQLPGLLVTAAVIIVGVALTVQYRYGPLAAAGVAGSAIALPPFVFFLTYSKSSLPSFATIMLLSTLGWAAGYLASPARGHNFYLGAAVIGLWVWFIEVTEHVFSFPGQFLSDVVSSSLSSSGLGSSSTLRLNAPDATNIGIYTLMFAAVYLVAGAVLDRRDQRGIATPFAFSGALTLFIGILALSDDLQQVGTGIAFTLAGLALVYLGATNGRRATNWAGAALVFLGLTLVVADPFDTASSFGFMEIVVALVVVFVAHVVSTQFREPPETDAVLSRFYNVGSVQVGAVPPAGSVRG